MSTAQHTVLALALVVLGLRLVATGRLQTAFSAVFGTPTAAGASAHKLQTGGTQAPGGQISGADAPKKGPLVA